MAVANLNCCKASTGELKLQIFDVVARLDCGVGELVDRKVDVVVDAGVDDGGSFLNCSVLPRPIPIRALNNCRVVQTVKRKVGLLLDDVVGFSAEPLPVLNEKLAFLLTSEIPIRTTVSLPQPNGNKQF